MDYEGFPLPCGDVFFPPSTLFFICELIPPVNGISVPPVAARNLCGFDFLKYPARRSLVPLPPRGKRFGGKILRVSQRPPFAPSFVRFFFFFFFPPPPFFFFFFSARWMMPVRPFFSLFFFPCCSPPETRLVFFFFFLFDPDEIPLQFFFPGKHVALAFAGSFLPPGQL